MPEVARHEIVSSDVVWTVPTLYVHIITVLNERNARYTQRFEDMEKAVLVALATSEKAMDKSAIATASKFESVNEFRGALEDAQRILITRAEVEAAIERISERIRELTERMTTSMPRTEATGLVDRTNERIKELTDRITTLETSISQMRGKGVGGQAAWGVLLGVVSIIAVACSLWLAFHR